MLKKKKKKKKNSLPLVENEKDYRGEREISSYVRSIILFPLNLKNTKKKFTFILET